MLYISLVVGFVYFVNKVNKDIDEACFEKIRSMGFDNVGEAKEYVEWVVKEASKKRTVSIIVILIVGFTTFVAFSKRGGF